MDEISVPRNRPDFRHWLAVEVAVSFVEPDAPPAPSPLTVCTTRRGEPLCSCGMFFLYWER